MLPIITIHIYDSVSANEPYVYDHSNKLNVKAKIRLQTVSLTVQSRLLFSINLRLKLYVINFEIQLILKTLKPTVLPFLTRDSRTETLGPNGLLEEFDRGSWFPGWFWFLEDGRFRSGFGSKFRVHYFMISSQIISYCGCVVSRDCKPLPIIRSMDRASRHSLDLFEL